MRPALPSLAAAAALLLGCAAPSVEVTRTVTPAEAAKLRGSTLAPTRVLRGDTHADLPAGSFLEAGCAKPEVDADAARYAGWCVRVPPEHDHVHTLAAGDVLETDEEGRIVAVRSASGARTAFKAGTAVSPPGAAFVKGDLDQQEEKVPLEKGDAILVSGTFEPGDEVPGGGRVVEHRRLGFTIVGAALFLGGYLPAAVLGGASSSDWDKALLAPLVGPWIALGMRPTPSPASCDPDPTACVSDTASRAGYVVSGLVQAVGVMGILVGLPVTSEYVPPEEARRRKVGPSLHAAPVSLPGGAGLLLGGSF
jgi:hypothetical protein